MRHIRLYFAVILFPVSWLYGVVVFLRNLFFDLGILKSISFTIPVISVGNITIGGTGKTPHIEYLINLFKNNRKIAVLSRGYKRKTKNFILADEGTGVNEIGDESRQIKSKFRDLAVAVDRNRVEGIRRLLSTFPDLEIILLDDAFQHRYVKPGLSIVLVDYERPLFRDFLLPMGNLRESRCNINRADMVIVTKCPPEMNELQRQDFFRGLHLLHRQPVFFTRYQYGNIIPVYEEKAKAFLMQQDRQNNPCILLVTGIAGNKPLKEYFSAYTTRMVALSFADHHSYKPADIRIIERKFAELPADSRIIVTTEKDAVKFKEMQREFQRIDAFLYYIPIEVRFLEGGEVLFNETVMNFCGKNRLF
jgi:tetraacyldisaccharide 4'-kinase